MKRKYFIRRLVLLLVALSVIVSGTVAVTKPADALNSWADVKGDNYVRVDDSCRSPRNVNPGSSIVLTCKGRRARVEPGYCTHIIRDFLDHITSCNYGKKAYYKSYGFAMFVTLKRVKI